MKLVFFGSPDFAVASLEALLRSPHQVLGVVTQPDRPAGRGLKLEPPPVKKLALAHNLPVLQPEKVMGQRHGSLARDISLCFFIVFFYWLLFSTGLSLGKSGRIPPLLAAWVPNLLFFAFGLFMVMRTRRA